MAKQTYPETALLKQVKGVGDLIATAYVLTIVDRIAFGRVVTPDVLWACSLGGGTRASEPQMHISKKGDEYLRTLLVQGAATFWDPLGKIVICGAGD
jgi:transposase